MIQFKGQGRRAVWSILILIITLVSACRNPTSVGADLLNEMDGLNPIFTDTLTIETLTQTEDSLFTANLSHNYIGTLDDPHLGRLFAALYCQVRLPSNNIDLGTNLQLDSAVLSIRYRRVYGDNNSQHSFRVYQLEDSLSTSQPYYNYTTFGVYPMVMGAIYNYRAVAGDSSIMRIPIKQDVGQWILDQSGTANMASNTNWLRFFKGILITPDTTMGYSNSLMEFDFTNVLTNLTLYYRSAVRDSLSFVLPISASSASSAYYRHSFTEPRIVEQTSGQVDEDSVNFLRGLAGLQVRIRIPHITELGSINIMKAELEVTQLALGLDSTYPPPTLLLPRVRKDTIGNPVYLALTDEGYSQDQSVYSFGGNRKEEMINGVKYYKYRINLARHLQFVVENQLENRDLYLKILPSVLSPQRAAIGGGNHPDDRLRMKLNLFYTRK